MENNLPLNKKDKRRRYLIGLLVSLIITALISGLFLLIQYLTGRRFPKDGLLMWINALTAAGGIIILFYFLILLSDGGAYDLLAYSIKLFWVNTFHKNVRATKLPPTFREYRELKRKNKRKESLSFILLGGLPYLIVGLLLLIPFYA